MYDVIEALGDRDDPVRVGVIGAGEFGRACINRIERVAGLETSAIADPV